MKALVLAAGLGTRLGALTENKPKCLIEVGGRTMLEFVIERLKAAGISEVIINLHYLSSQIREYVAAKNNFGIKVRFSFEEHILDTGGAVKFARELLSEDDFVVHNSDVYSELDLIPLIEKHKASRAEATLAVMERPTDRVLLFDQNDRLLGWQNFKTGDKRVVRDGTATAALGFSGIQVCSPRIFAAMKDLDDKFSIITAYMKLEESGDAVRAYRIDSSYWIDMGTPERLSELRRRLDGGSI